MSVIAADIYRRRAGEYRLLAARVRLKKSARAFCQSANYWSTWLGTRKRTAADNKTNSRLSSRLCYLPLTLNVKLPSVSVHRHRASARDSYRVKGFEAHPMVLPLTASFPRRPAGIRYSIRGRFYVVRERNATSRGGSATVLPASG